MNRRFQTIVLAGMLLAFLGTPKSADAELFWRQGQLAPGGNGQRQIQNGFSTGNTNGDVLGAGKQATSGNQQQQSFGDQAQDQGQDQTNGQGSFGSDQGQGNGQNRGLFGVFGGNSNAQGGDSQGQGDQQQRRGLFGRRRQDIRSQGQDLERGQGFNGLWGGQGQGQNQNQNQNQNQMVGQDSEWNIGGKTISQNRNQGQSQRQSRRSALQNGPGKIPYDPNQWQFLPGSDTVVQSKDGKRTAEVFEDGGRKWIAMILTDGDLNLTGPKGVPLKNPTKVFEAVMNRYCQPGTAGGLDKLSGNRLVSALGVLAKLPLNSQCLDLAKAQLTRIPNANEKAVLGKRYESKLAANDGTANTTKTTAATSNTATTSTEHAKREKTALTSDDIVPLAGTTHLGIGPDGIYERVPKTETKALGVVDKDHPDQKWVSLLFDPKNQQLMRDGAEPVPKLTAKELVDHDCEHPDRVAVPGHPARATFLAVYLNLAKEPQKCLETLGEKIKELKSQGDVETSETIANEVLDHLSNLEPALARSATKTWSHALVSLARIVPKTVKAPVRKEVTVAQAAPTGSTTTKTTAATTGTSENKTTGTGKSNTTTSENHKHTLGDIAEESKLSTTEETNSSSELSEKARNQRLLDLSSSQNEGEGGQRTSFLRRLLGGVRSKDTSQVREPVMRTLEQAAQNPAATQLSVNAAEAEELGLSLGLLHYAKHFEGEGTSSEQRAFALERIRKKIPTQLMSNFSRGYTESLIPEGPMEDKCEYVCHILDTYDQWGRDGSVPSWANGSAAAYHWAVTSIQALYALKAAPFCPEHSDLVNKLLQKWMAQSFNGQQQFAVKNNGTPGYSYQVYGKAFSLFLLRAFKEGTGKGVVSPEVTKGLMGILAKDGINVIQNSMSNDLLDSRALPGTKAGGSGVHTSAYATALLALDNNARGKGDLGTSPLEFFNNRVKQLRSQSPETNNWPYDLSPQRRPDGPCSSSARAVVANGVSARQNPTPENLKALDDSLDNFYTYAGSLISQVSRDATHWGVCYLAPYYWYPTISFATALARWRSETNTDSSKVAELTERRRNIERAASASRVGNSIIGLGSSYGDSPSWSYPEAGLSFLAAADSCKVGGQLVSSMGILPGTATATVGAGENSGETSREVALETGSKSNATKTSGKTENHSAAVRGESDNKM
jgi:hypothetical protein